MTIATLLFAAFAFALGLCTGSFLNVAIWRLPYRGQAVTYAGRTGKLSLHWPPSHCPQCNQPIAFYHNVPVLGWFILRGRCARCKTPIAVRYPLVELGTGVCFAALYLAYAVGGWHGGTLADIRQAWPVLALQWIFTASLLAAAGTDADWYIIPLEIPIMLVALALAWCIVKRPGLPMAAATGVWAKAAIGGAVGLLLAGLLLHLGVLPRSFPEEADADESPETAATGAGKPLAEPHAAAATNPTPQDAAVEPPPGPPGFARQRLSLMAVLAIILILAILWALAPWRAATVLSLAGGILIFFIGILPRNADAADVTAEVEEEIAAPHARREILKELLFLAVPALAAVVAALLPWHLPAGFVYARIAGALAGALVAGALVWLVRIFGTLAFGRQAMGLGDVHFMAAVGAVVGGPLAVVAFFMAPFVALLWALVLKIMKKPNVLPFGPWLAVASILVMLIGPPIVRIYEGYLLGTRNSRVGNHSKGLIHHGYVWPGEH